MDGELRFESLRVRVEISLVFLQQIRNSNWRILEVQAVGCRDTQYVAINQTKTLPTSLVRILIVPENLPLFLPRDRSRSVGSIAHSFFRIKDTRS